MDLDATLDDLTGFSLDPRVVWDRVFGAGEAPVVSTVNPEGLRAELHGSRVKVTVVFPGAVGTNITANSGVSIPGQEPSPEGEATAAKTTSPADAAATILRGI